MLHRALDGENLTSMLRSKAMGDFSIPFAKKTLDMQDIYPWKEEYS